MSKLRVLFLCTGNSARSQMAEGYLRHVAGDRFDVASAGIDPTAVTPLAIEAMREIGIYISAHASKTADSLLDQHFHYVVTVCDNASEHCPIFPGAAKRLHWPFADPATASGNTPQRLAVFRRVRDDITERVRAFAEDPALSAAVG